MWLERILIVWNTLSHSFLPSMDRVFFPTFWDWLFLFGPMFFFALDVPAVLPGRAGRADVRRAGTPAARGFAMSASERAARHRRVPSRGRPLRGGAQRATQGFRPLDALSPCPVEGLDDILRLDEFADPLADADRRARRRGAAYAVEFWTAVYRLSDRLGRPAAEQLADLSARAVRSRRARRRVAGFAALLVLCGLPRLHHPLFDWDAIERATDDRYFLLVRRACRSRGKRRPRTVLYGARAVADRGAVALRAAALLARRDGCGRLHRPVDDHASRITGRTVPRRSSPTAPRRRRRRRAPCRRTPRYMRKLPPMPPPVDLAVAQARQGAFRDLLHALPWL